MKELIHWWRIFRGANLLIMFAAQLLVYFFIIKSLAGDNGQFLTYTVDNHILAIQCLLLVAGGGYVINNYFDVETDKINRPDKQIIGKYISGSEAMIGYGFVNITAILGGLFIDNNFAIFLLINMLLLYVYARYLKKIAFLGNVLIALLSAVQFWQVLVLEYNLFFKILYPNQYSGYYLHFLLTFSLFVFIFSLVRELLKTVEDEKGDAQAGIKTLAVLKGAVFIKNICLGLTTLAALGLFYISWSYWTEANHFGAIYVGWGLFFPMLWLIWKIKKAEQQADFARLSTWAKFYFLLGLGWICFI
jgi:4-hydroxybenzoate polyprenyltransferase